MRANDDDACIAGKPHYWNLPVASGPSSLGVCKHCGGKRLFKNYLVDPRLWLRRPTVQEDRR
jgi:hypothetical protein